MRGPLGREFAGRPGGPADLRRELTHWRAPSHLVGSAQAVLRGVWRAVLPSTGSSGRVKKDYDEDDESDDDHEKQNISLGSRQTTARSASAEGDSKVEDADNVVLDIESIMAIKAAISNSKEQ